MSLRNCLGRTEENCVGADGNCTLEYDANHSNPTCVPKIEDVTQQFLSDDDLLRMRRILVRLLPPTSHTELSKTKLIISLTQLYAELTRKIDEKMRVMLFDKTYASWRELVETISREIIHEIQEVMCPICQDIFKDSPRRHEESLVTVRCCGHIFHRSCLREWVGVNAVCPLCSTVLNAVTLRPANTMSHRTHLIGIRGQHVHRHVSTIAAITNQIIDLAVNVNLSDVVRQAEFLRLSALAQAHNDAFPDASFEASTLETNDVKPTKAAVFCVVTAKVLLPKHFKLEVVVDKVVDEFADF